MKVQLTILLFFSICYSSELAVLKVANVPAKSLYITQPDGEKDLLFVLNQKGQIHIIKNGTTLNTPFLDISDRVHGSLVPGSEEGLLGLAFHPDYLANGFFYVNYVNKKDTSIVSRFTVTENPEKANKESETIILQLSQPFGNHNGGHLAFGPKDGMLYIGFGDGGKWGDPYNNGQNLNSLLGSILRIDINKGDFYSIPKDNPFVGDKSKRAEIFCYGLRNPWRFSFDRKTNDLIIGDVGQNLWEEVNWNSWENAKGANFGWRIMEGNHCYNPEDFCDTTGLIQPVHEYPNNAAYMKILLGMDEAEATGCSVTGGYVYRGKENPDLYGRYIFGDYCTGRIWSFKLENGKPVGFINLRNKIKKHSSDIPLFISSFGEDSSGELYIVDYLGAVYKFVSNK
jgi:glucose/arabinose dehydrogenase|tara:strand:+ start:4784 stop:5977 length:1194 start_codon:yes stop_codon:yes gene_type:complete